MYISILDNNDHLKKFRAAFVQKAWFKELRVFCSYDGMIIFTDGYAPKPKMSPRTIRKTLWICDNKANYHQHREWMERCGKCCGIRGRE